MDVLDAIKGRRSIRKFSSEPIEADKIERVVEAGRLAPSARNQQLWKFIVADDKNVVEKIFDSYGGPDNFKNAPAVIVTCGLEPESKMKCGQPRHTVDVSIATAFMVLEAYEVGLGTCWLGSYEEQKVKDVLGIPEDVRIVAMLPIGYPDEQPQARPRKLLDEIVCKNTYQ